MPFAHTLEKRLHAALDFVGKWACHTEDCDFIRKHGACTCGYTVALHDLYTYCLEKVPGKKKA
jgi:hypothetical protein